MTDEELNDYETRWIKAQYETMAWSWQNNKPYEPEVDYGN